MKLNLLIVDDFYTNPDAVREYALAQPFDVTGNFPGVRTAPYLPDDVKAAIQYWIQPYGGRVTTWFEEQGFTGAFQLATANDRTWIHADYYNDWAAVCYLTPDAPHTSGTGLYRHKASGEYQRTDSDHEGNDYTKWDLIDVVGNRYNRLVIYQGNLFHASLNYFGDCGANGRLFQTFFFSTERK